MSHPVFRLPATGRHARTSHPARRLALTTALSGVLLPIGLTATAAPAAAQTREESVTRISGPGSTPPGRTVVSVRLVSDGSYVRNGVVDVQIPEGSGWRTVARTSTDDRGLGHVAVQLRDDQRFRSHYRGSSVRTPATSDAIVVDVKERGNRVLAEAAKHRGKPYRYGATGPSAFDCSGFTRYVYAKMGKSLPHNSNAQERATRRVSKSAARPGDLVFIKDVAGHVGIYAGNGKMWDAPRAGKTVTLRRIWTSNYTVGRV